MLLESEGGIWAEADSRVFAMLMAPNRTARRLMAAERTKGGAFQRVAALRKRQDAQAAREHRKAERELEKELASGGISGPWGRSMRIRIPESAPAQRPSSGTRTTPSRKPMTSAGVRRTRAYIAPIVDDRGRIALTFCVRYKGLKSKGWRPGLAADHVLYILREEALEGGDGDLTVSAVPISNMGVSADEIADAWRALEEGYRANAKVQYRIIWSLPHDLDADQRREMVAAFCERTFGRLGLPYVAAIHEPDDKGDQRNYHAHICFSTRPCERTAPSEWVIAQEKVNGLTDPAGLKLMRALAAAHMNIICAKAGKRVRFTHQTYEERGIDAERLEHVGPAAMAAHERGEVVGVIARNDARIESNEAAEACRQAERRLAESSRHFELLRCREALDTTRACIVRSAAMARSLLDRARSIVPTIALGAHVKSKADHMSKVIAVRKRAEAIVTAAKPTPRTGKAILSTIAVRRGSAALLDRIGKAGRGGNVERLLATADMVMAKASALSGIGDSASHLRARQVSVIDDLARRAASLAAVDVHAGVPAISRTQASVLAHTSARISPMLGTGSPGVRLALQRPKVARAALAAAPLAAGIDASSRSAVDRQQRIDVITDALAAYDIRQAERDAEEARERTRREGIERQQQGEDRRRKEAELVARRQHDAKIAEACRFIQTARSRPYRIAGDMVTGDWSVFLAEDRALLHSLGGDPELIRALQARFQADRRADQEREAAPVAADKTQISDTASPSVRSVEDTASAAPKGDREPKPADVIEQTPQRGDLLQSTVDLDPWVRVPASGPLTIGDADLAALRQDRDWLEGRAAQQALREIADSQERRILGALDHLAWEGKRLAAREPYANLNPALLRWSRDDDFFGYLHSVAPHLAHGRAGVAGLEGTNPKKSQAETPRRDSPPMTESRVPPWLRSPGGGFGD